MRLFLPMLKMNLLLRLAEVVVKIRLERGQMKEPGGTAAAVAKSQVAEMVPLRAEAVVAAKRWPEGLQLPPAVMVARIHL